MKYEYGVEYANDGNNPDLNDDVVVEVYSLADERWNKGKQGDWNWRARTITKFRIVDERYKPAEKDNNWFERGEFPPVGFTQNECEATGTFYDTFAEFKVVAHEQEHAIVVVTKYKNGGRGCWPFALRSHHLRPIRTEREKVIEAAMKAVSSANEFILGDLYDAGLLRLPEDK